MRIYWSLESIPELASLPKPERKRLLAAAERQLLRDRKFWAALLVFLLWILVAVVLADLIPSVRLGILVMLLAAVAGGVPFGHVLGHLTRPYIRELLERRP